MISTADPEKRSILLLILCTWLTYLKHYSANSIAKPVSIPLDVAKLYTESLIIQQYDFLTFLLDTIRQLIHTVTHEQTQTWQGVPECWRAHGDDGGFLTAQR